MICLTRTTYKYYKFGKSLFSELLTQFAKSAHCAQIVECETASGQRGADGLLVEAVRGTNADRRSGAKGGSSLTSPRVSSTAILRPEARS